MGSVGDYYDNAMRESFVATLKCELLPQTEDDGRCLNLKFLTNSTKPG